MALLIRHQETRSQWPDLSLCGLNHRPAVAAVIAITKSAGYDLRQKRDNPEQQGHQTDGDAHRFQEGKLVSVPVFSLLPKPHG
jgi:hypothetical protein